MRSSKKVLGKESVWVFPVNFVLRQSVPVRCALGCFPGFVWGLWLGVCHPVWENICCVLIQLSVVVFVWKKDEVFDFNVSGNCFGNEQSSGHCKLLAYFFFYKYRILFAFILYTCTVLFWFLILKAEIVNAICYFKKPNFA